MDRNLVSAALLALALSPSLAQAQIAPSRVVPQTRPDQVPTPPHSREVQPANPTASNQTPKITPFKLTRVEIQGSSLAQDSLAATYRAFIGQTVDSQSLQKISDAVAAAYAKTDVALYTVLVPDQTFTDGVLKLAVVEGYIEGVDFEGSAASRDRGLAEAYIGKVKTGKGQPASRRQLQRAISLVRDIPGLSADVQLVSGAQVGAVRLHVKLEPHHIQLGLGINNRGTAYLGRTQAQADLYANSLFRQGEQTRLTVAVPTDPELFQFYGVGHSEPLGTNGTTLQLNASYLRTRPLNTALLGHATSFGLQVSHPVIRSFDHNLYVTAGIDGVDSDNAFFGFTFSDDRTRALRLSTSFDRSTDNSLFSASGSLSHGIAGLGARVTSPEASRRDFTKLNARLGYNRALGAPVVLRLSAIGQYSRDRLPASEQMALGGEEFGRAFEASYVAGDYGYAGSAELAWRPQNLSKRVAGSELYAFADDGKVWYRSRFGFPTADARLSSAGAGVRVAISGRALVQAEAAKGLTNPLPYLNRDGWRGIFSVRTLF